MSEIKESSEAFIWITDFSTESSIKEHFTKFIELEEDDEVDVIPIYINSTGGEVMVLTALRDMIKSSKKPVMTVALGQALSSGAYLLAAGTKGLRFASKDAFIMIHEVSGGVIGKSTDMAADAKWSTDLTKVLFKNLAEDTGTTYAKIVKRFESLKNADWVMTAKQAKAAGLIDHIGVPRIRIKPSTYMIDVDAKIKSDINKIIDKFQDSKKKK